MSAKEIIVSLLTSESSLNQINPYQVSSCSYQTIFKYICLHKKCLDFKQIFIEMCTEWPMWRTDTKTLPEPIMIQCPDASPFSDASPCLGVLWYSAGRYYGLSYSKWDGVYFIIWKVCCRLQYGAFNSSPPSATYMCQWTGSALVQIMACRLFGAKPLSEPMYGCCQLDPKEYISVTF